MEVRLDSTSGISLYPLQSLSVVMNLVAPIFSSRSLILGTGSNSEMVSFRRSMQIQIDPSILKTKTAGLHYYNRKAQHSKLQHFLQFFQQLLWDIRTFMNRSLILEMACYTKVPQKAYSKQGGNLFEDLEELCSFIRTKKI